jgi:hypothetical protein
VLTFDIQWADPPYQSLPKPSGFMVSRVRLDLVLPWLFSADLNSSGKTIKLPRLNFFLSEIPR